MGLGLKVLMVLGMELLSELGLKVCLAQYGYVL